MKTLGVLLVTAVAAGIGYAAGGDRARMEPGEEVAAMLEDLPGTAAKLPAQSPVRQAVEAGEVERARQMLAFRPLAEAPVPEGFPPFTPVGVIAVKEYPAYRKAEGPGFWPLFQHIKTEKIPMTAPVEMNQASGPSGQRPMAFLYQNTSVGNTGEANGVDVVDAEKALAVSLGVRGRMTKANADDAKTRLEGWLKDHPEYVARGEQPFRLFGYNSPMVPNNEKYWEAQMVIEPASKKTEATATESPAESPQ